jgi:hypothetical protein
MDERDRLLPVDAVRGIAMFFIGVSHISFYLINDSVSLASMLRAIGFVATPNFLLMSGLACGYQLAAAPTTATALRILDRGLFAFLVGHLLVCGSLVYMVPPGTAFEHIVITDSIGVLLCMAPLLKHAGARRLLWSGAAVYLVSSTFALAWHPVTHGQVVLGALLLSINDGGMPDIGWVTPTLAYMGIFLFGVGLGKLIREHRRDGRSRVLSARLAVAGSVAILLALALNIGRHFVKPLLMQHWAAKNWADVLLTAMNVRHDSPPTLAYALFYGGIGVALVGYLGLLSQREPVSPLMRGVRFAAVIGRASFVSYILQQWLIDFIPVWVGFDSWLTPATAPLYLVLNTVVMYWVASVWGRYKANRCMTFGLPSIYRPPIEVPVGGGGVAVIAAPMAVARVGRSHWADGRVPLFTGIVAVVIVVNILALENAPKLTPHKLELVPTNPYPWLPAKFAGH